MYTIASPKELIPAIRAAGFGAVELPPLPSDDIHRDLPTRLADGERVRRFLEAHPVDLVIDFDTSALTLTPHGSAAGSVALTTAALGISYAALFIDPVTAVMNDVPWPDRWALLESRAWIKAVWDTAHAQELRRFGVPNVVRLPMAVVDDDFDTSPPPASPPGDGAVVAFMGHPASSFFRSGAPVLPPQLLPGLIAAAAAADRPGTPFHEVYYEGYGLAEPPHSGDDAAARARKTAEYFAAKFVYNAYLAVKQRDRFAIFLKRHLGDRFELIGDYWEQNYGLPATPRIWDRRALYERIRSVPICLNLLKGNLESGVILRHFEVTAWGGFLLTYPTPELPQFFEVGRECEVFHDERDLLDKIRYYADHRAERLDIAAAGQRRTLREHLYSHRITTLVETLRRGGAAMPAPAPGQAAAGHASRPRLRIHVAGLPEPAAL